MARHGTVDGLHSQRRDGGKYAQRPQKELNRTLNHRDSIGQSLSDFALFCYDGKQNTTHDSGVRMSRQSKPPSPLNRIISLMQTGPRALMLRFYDQGMRKWSGSPVWK